MHRLAFLAALLTGITCGTPTYLCGCSPVPPTQLTIYGSVTRQSQPVHNATLRFFASPGGCAGSQQVVGSAPLLPMTDASGSYRAQLLLIEPSDSLCVRVTAIDASRAPIDSVTVVRQPVAARLSYTSVPVDSMRVDVSFALP